MTEFLIALGAIAVTLLSTWIVKNERLREGITGILLKRLRRQSLKEIPLKEHRVFVDLTASKQHFSLDIFTNDVKEQFFKKYVVVLFEELETTLENIITNYEEVDNIDNLILSKITACGNNIDMRLEALFDLPTNVKKIVSLWKTGLSNSFVRLIEITIHDDLLENDYFKVYRVMDMSLGFTQYTLNTGKFLFETMNGAFDSLKIEDIIKSETKEEIAD